MPKAPDISSEEKAYEARYGHRQDILHDPFDRGWNMGWAACEARYRELVVAATRVCDRLIDGGDVGNADIGLRLALIALTEKEEEAKP